MEIRVACLSLFLPVAACAQPWFLGTNQLWPGKIMEFAAPVSAKAKWEASRVHQNLRFATGALAVPPGFDFRKPWPILEISVPSGGSSIGAMRQYTNVAFQSGWVVLAGEGPRVDTETDTIQWGWAMLGSVLDFFSRTWPQTKPWPVACAGFSGGAKRAATVAAAMMRENYRVIGIFMGGCNEDWATVGLKLFQPGERFKRVPIFLSSGSRDPIAGPQQTTPVQRSLRYTGFERIRLETYDGEHRLDAEQLKLALEWFKRSTSSPK